MSVTLPIAAAATTARAAGTAGRLSKAGLKGATLRLSGGRGGFGRRMKGGSKAKQLLTSPLAEIGLAAVQLKGKTKAVKAVHQLEKVDDARRPL
ncbi:MAG: hypothetical protein IPG45_06800 [Deltaproteobacteria bacterium]|nr:hypothetical protein [Deltaproteobacteria bacterium]